MLEVKQISKSYHGKKVVNSVSFTLEAGQLLGIIGANGAGKSTLISMLATIIRPDSGEILFEGTNIVKKPGIIRASMGYVPQDIALYETLSGLDNLKFWGKSYGIKGPALSDSIKRVSQIIGFDDAMLKKRVNEYSGGMKRRLNIGVALLHNPKLVIFDEPTTGIDIDSGEQIQKAITDLRNSGTAVIYAGHYLEEVERLATHILIMDEGMVPASGAKDELLSKHGVGSVEELYRELCGRKREQP